MNNLSIIDYLILGHISYDITVNGARLGGTVSYSTATALAFNKKVGIVTSWGEESELELGILKTVPIHNHPSKKSTTFENIQTSLGRKQILYHTAKTINYSDIPEKWQNTHIIHLAPIVHEVSSEIIDNFNNQFIGLTPQGWFRHWEDDGVVTPIDWNFFLNTIHYQNLKKANAVIISDEDVQFSTKKIEDIANQCSLLVVTMGAAGCDVYWQNKTYHIPAPKVIEVDAIGAGDIFASTFFIQLLEKQDVLYAAKVATSIAAFSVTRSGQNSAPSSEEIKMVLKE